MTDHPTDDSRDPAVSNRLSQHQHALDSAFDGVLDIEAGLREILIHSRHDTAVDQLGTILDTEAGLAAILPPAASQLPAPDAGDPAGAEEFPLALSPAKRMTLRNDPDVKAASRVLARNLNLTRALAHDRDPARALDRTLDRALDLTLALNRALDRDLDRAFNLVRDLGLNLDLTLAHARDLNRTLARTLARDLDQAGGPVRALARDLDLARIRTLDLDLDLARALDLVLTLDLARARALDLDVARVRALGLARALDLDRALGRARAVILQICANEVCRAIGWVLRREPPVLGTDSVRLLLDDFTNADLRTTDLTGIDLSGVHWSEHTTLWPTAVDVEDLKTHSDETPPGSGTWVIRSGTATIRDHATSIPGP